MKQVKSPVVSALEAAPETYLLWLEAPEIAGSAKPGQFIMVACGGDAFLPRPFSIHRVDNSQIALLFKVVGKGTCWLAEQKKGSLLDVFGPLGNGFTIEPDSQNLLLVSGGIGIAPLVFLADEAVKQEKRVTLLMGASSSVHLLPEGQLTHGLLTDGVLPFNINITKITDDGSEGFRGLVTTLLTDAHYVKSADQVFACGPAAMYRTMAQMPELKGKNVQLSLEIMMGCGTGVCYGCTIKTKKGLKQVCKDGPVFEMGELQL